MSLLKFKHEFEFPSCWTECEMTFKYPLENNRIFIINENWEYLIFDTLRGEIAREGKKLLVGKFTEETVNGWEINSIYSYWFTFTSSHTMIYYSHTDHGIFEWNFLEGKRTGSWDVKITLSEDAKYFCWMEYYQDSQSLIFLHMKNQNTAQVDLITRGKEPEKKHEINLVNANCMIQNEGRLFFGTQNIENSPFKIHVLDRDHLSTLTFNFNTSLCPLEFGFIKPNQGFILYNYNDKRDAGLFVIDFNLHDFSKDAEFDLYKDERIVKKTLQGDDDPCMFDGRVVVDRIMNSIIISTMDRLRTY